jgi:hypothetical protein
MITPFKPAGEILGPDCEVRSIVLKDEPRLPDGAYDLIDTYCTDPACDCRKTIIQIFYDKTLVSIVSFGWESPKFYLRWLKSTRDHELANEMSGVSIDFSSPDRVSREGILALMHHLLDDKWISLIKDHYWRIRTIIKEDNIVCLPPKVARNAPCPCGSGKKYKKCCL